MATRIRTLLVISALLVSSLFMLMNADPAFSSQPDNKPADVSSAPNLGYVPGQVLVEFKEGVSAGRRTQVGAGAGADKTLARLGPRGKKDVHLLQLKAGVSVEQAVRKLRGSNDVVLAEPNYIRHSTVIPMPNDPSFANQWGLFNNGQTIGGIAGTIDADIDAEVAWDSSERSDSNPVTVAVIDSGIDQNHPDLSGSLWRNPGEVAGNGVDDDANGYVDDVNGFNLAGISMTYSNAAWFMGDTNTSWRGQSITGTGQRLTQVGLLVRRVGTPTANIEIVVRDALGGTDLATATIASGSVGNDWLVIDSTLSTPVVLTAGNTYYILFRSTAASAANYYVLAGNSDERADWLPDPYRGGGQHWWNGTAWVAGRANADWYFTTNANANPQDDNGHGTHVTGIIGAQIDNAVGIAGVSYGARIMVLKAGSSSGSLASSDIIEALHYAADNGAKVINMSFGGPVYSSLEKAAIDYAYNKGAALFAAAGNHRATEDPQTFNFPASYLNVVGVGATTNRDTRATFSNYNTSVDVSAPGQDIYSTMPTYAVSLNSATVGQDYAYLSGTSMATPMVVGLAGLILSRNPEYTAAQVMQVIETTLIDDKGPGGWDSSFGTGRITGVGLANAVSVGNNRIDGNWWAPSPQPPSYVTTFGESLDSQGDRNDFFSVSVAAGQRIRVSMTAPSGTDFDLYLYPPGTTDASLLPGGIGSAVASSVGGTYPETFSYIPSAGAGGTYYLRVNAKSGRGSYTITYSVMDADNEMPGVPIPASPVNEDLRNILDENDVFSVSLAEGQQIMAGLTGSTNTDFGLYLYSPGSADFSSTPVAASVGGGYPRKFKYVVPAGAAGRYYLRAAMIDGSFNGTYTLTYSVGPADVTPPITTLSTSPTLPDGDSGWFKTAPTITLASNEGGVTYIQWQTTWAGWWETYTNPFVAYEGNNTLYYYSVDLSENQETTRATSIKLDMSAPVSPTLSSGSHTLGVPSNDSTVDVSVVGASDPISGVDGYSASWTQNSTDAPDTTKDVEESVTQITSPSLTDGAWYLHLRTKDNAGNWTAAVHLGPFAIDVTAPVSTLTTTPASADGTNGWFISTPTITLGQVSETGTAYYQWDSTSTAGWTQYVGALTALEGVHTLHFYSVDAVGNVESTRQQVVKTDTGAPSAPVLSAVATDATTVTLSWPAATDSVSGVFGYRIYDGVSNVLLGSTSALTFTVTGLTPGAENRYYVIAVDNAGHESSHSNTVKIATVPLGSDVTVTVESVTVAFSSVVTAGGVTVTTSTTPPATQTGFQLNGVYYDVSTNTGYAGPITITLPYDPNTTGDPQTLRLYHYDENLGSWIDVTVGVDTVQHIISGRVASFSWFATGQPQQVFGGFGPPINPDGTSVFKLGQTLPVKFHLADADGFSVTDAVARIYVAQVVDGVPGVEKLGTSSTPKVKNVFRYSDTTDEYVFNLETKKLTEGVWQLRVLMDDGLSYVVLVSLSSK